MLTRDLKALKSEEFDALVIGGGINGAAIAWEAALRGLKVALIERGDFGSGASQGCFRIAHGGLRYLQHLDLRRLRESAQEQKILRGLAPHLVRPFPFLVPCYAYGMKGREALRLGMFLYESLTSRRNSGLEEELHLAKHQVLSTSETLALAPGLNPEGLRGGVIYHDCQITSSDRLTLAVVQAAVDCGAVAANYCSVVRFERAEGSSGAIVEAFCRDETTGQKFSLKAKYYINATGPWSRLVAGLGGNHAQLKRRERVFSKGVQLVFPRLNHARAVAVESRDYDAAAVVRRGGRSYFLVPWMGRTLAGTYDVAFEDHPDAYTITEGEISAFVTELRSAYQDPKLNLENVQHAFGGLRAVDPQQEFTTALPGVARQEFIVEHSKQGGPSNLISVEGVKYTTFRALAERVVNLLTETFPDLAAAGGSKSLKLPGGDFRSLTEEVQLLSARYPQLEASAQHLVGMYGNRTSAVAEVVAEDERFLKPVTAGAPVLLGELVYAARYEMVEQLTDLIMRRSILGALGYPGQAALQLAAKTLAPELGWDTARCETEVALVTAEFPVQARFAKSNARTR